MRKDTGRGARGSGRKMREDTGRGARGAGQSRSQSHHRPIHFPARAPRPAPHALMSFTPTLARAPRPAPRVLSS